jgi:hypothetical protein
MIGIHPSARASEGSFLRSSSREKGTVEHSELHFPCVIGNGDGEKAGILIVHVNEIDIVKRRKGRKSDPLPVEQILRNRQGNPGAI